MINHHTKNKGDLGILKVQLDLFSRGYLVCEPKSEHQPFDLVAYKDGKFYRLQVKYRTKNKFGLIEVPYKTSWADKNGNHIKKYDYTEVDWFVIYCPDTDECYYIQTGNNMPSGLRVDVPKIISPNINWAKDYKKF